MRIKHGPEQTDIGMRKFTCVCALLLGFVMNINAVPLNVVNMEGMDEAIPKMRADYGFYAADNQSAFKGDTYLDLMADNANLKARSSPNAIHRSGCRYKATIYASGDNVPTEESCLFCHCKGSVVVCKLRVCPDVPNPPPPGCIVVQKANKCCSQLVCHDNLIRKLAREQRLSESNATETLPTSALQTLHQDQGNYCVHEGTVYAEGSAMRSSTLCEHCFCIHGKMKCSSPQCLIPLKGCKPRYRSYACCPTNYDCNQSNQTAILKTPISTPVPSFLKGCTVGGLYVGEGDPILPMQLLASQHATNNSLGISRCQTCFCMGGVVHCRPLACDRPIEGCRPVIDDGHCCPDRYECDKPEEGQEATTPGTGQDDEGSETSTPPLTTTPLPETTSTQVYEIRFEKVPLFKARKDGEQVQWVIPKNNALNKKKEPRISYTSVGGFKNRASGDTRGSREQRRKNKERSEFLPRTFYDDDAREDSSLSFESSSGRSDEHSSVFLEEKSEASTSSSDADEELPTSETEPSFVTEINEIKAETPADDGGDTSTLRVVTEADMDSRNNEETSATEVINTKLQEDDDEASDIVPLTLTNDLRLEPLPIVKITTTTIQPELALSSSTSPIPVLSSSSNPTPTPTPESILNLSETTIGKLEFISFGMEDAVFSPMNETHYEIHPGQATSIPMQTYNLVARQGSLIPSTSQKQGEGRQPGKSTPVPSSRPLLLDPPLPPLKLIAPLEEVETISVLENREPPREPIVFIPEQIPNTIMDVPVQTSLYNNGHYGQSLVPDDQKDVDLVITQAELNHQKQPDSSEDFPMSPVPGKTLSSTPTKTTTSPPIAPPSPTTGKHKPQLSTKKPHQPFTSITSNDKFIPISSPNNDTRNPSRTYSKFGIQDSSHRYGYPSVGFGNGSPDEGERLFIPHPSIPIPPPPSSYGLLHGHQNPPNLMNRKVPSFSEDPAHRLRYNNPFHQHRVVDPDPNPSITYDDETNEETNDNGSEEFGSYESYFNPHQSNMRPPSPNPGSITPLGHRTGVASSHPQPLPPSSSNFNPSAGAPIPMISISDTKVSLSSKDKTTSRPGTKTKIVNSKPLRRPQPIENLQESGDPLGFKPVVAFPFAIPKSQDKFNMGLKLSGCNIYGKMHGIGQVIHELSSICVQCKCTEVGVQCSELQC